MQQQAEPSAIIHHRADLFTASNIRYATRGPMAIQFNCTGCGKKVNTPDQMAGKKGKCPHCQSIVQIPSASPPAKPTSGSLKVLDDLPTRPTPLAPLPTADPLGMAPAPNPLGDIPAQNFGAPAPNPFPSPMMANAPQAYAPQASGSVKGKIMGPAIGMIVASSIIILWDLKWIVSLLVEGAQASTMSGNKDLDNIIVGFLFAFIALIIVHTAMYVVVLFGAIRMLMLKSYRLCMAATIISLIPCAFLFVLGLPFGIWGLVMLLNPEVKRAFK